MKKLLKLASSVSLLVLALAALAAQPASADGCGQTCGTSYNQCIVYGGALYCWDSPPNHCNAAPSTCLPGQE